MENGLPSKEAFSVSSRSAVGFGLPVAAKVPQLDQRPVLPGKCHLVPNFFIPRVKTAWIRLAGARRIARDVRTGLEFEKYMIAIDQRRLIVNKQLAKTFRFFLVNEGIESDVLQLTVGALTDGGS